MHSKREFPRLVFAVYLRPSNNVCLYIVQAENLVANWFMRSFRFRCSSFRFRYSKDLERSTDLGFGFKEVSQ